MLEGEPTLRTPDGETRLRPWDTAVFRRGDAGAHQLRNDTDDRVRAAFFSSVSDPEVAVYPDDDIQLVHDSDGKRRYAHKDGTPY